MMREITAAGDRERTGALDVEWSGSQASVFFMFGHPSHVVFTSTDGRSLCGDEALGALVRELPVDFTVAPWRRAMVTEDTLHLTAEDLIALFPGEAAGTEGTYQPAVVMEPEPAPAPAPVLEHQAGPAVAPGDAESAATDAVSASHEEPREDEAAASAMATATTASPVDAGSSPATLQQFPLLPLGAALWSDDAANVVDLPAILPRLPDCLLVLVGPGHHGAAIVADGAVVDAVWRGGEDGATLLGPEAATALMSATEGTLSAHRLDDQRLATALPVLWRGRRSEETVPAAWLHADGVIAEARASARSGALLVQGDNPGVALLHEGDLVAVYSSAQRRPSTSRSALRDLLGRDGATVTVAGDISPAPSAETRARDGAGTAIAADATTDSATTVPRAGAWDESAAADDVPVPETALPAAAAGAWDDDITAGHTYQAFEPPTFGVDGAQVLQAEPVSQAEPLSDESPQPQTDPGPDAEAEPQPQGWSERRAAADDAPPTEPATWHDAPGTDQPVAADVESAFFSITFPQAAEDTAAAPAPAAAVQPAPQFTPARLEIDVDALRAELSKIGVDWLGEDDAAPVTTAIAATPPGVDDFVATIAAVGAMDIPGHERAVVRAMAREMNYRATEVLCGV